MRPRSLLRAVLVLLFAVVFVNAHALAGANTRMMAHRSGSGQSLTSFRSYHDQWRKLWEDHITWTRMVIVGVFKDLPCTNDYAGRLLQNPNDMADALRPYYGDEAADHFADLVTDHLTIAVEVLSAAKVGDTAAFEEANARWYANGEEIAALMTQLNPRGWPADESEMMWEEHLDATLAEAVAVLQDQCAADVQAYDTVHDMALEMADFFSDGVAQQFRSRFSGSDRCDDDHDGDGGHDDDDGDDD